MSREIVIDTDTIVGYNYLNKKFYVTNKKTRTYRSTKEDIKTILNIVAPTNTVTLEQLQELATVYETLNSLYYTLYDSGAYIATLQINDYKDYALTIDCEKQALYVYNTTLLFNLTLNESRDSRVTVLIDYYKNTLGILLTRQQVTAMYNLLISMYVPYVYNVIKDTSSSPVTYSNIFAISNWDKKSKAVYNCTTNPNNIFYNTDSADIIEASTSTNTFCVINPTTSTTNLVAGDTIVVTGTTTQTDTYTYSADGTYTIASINTTSTPIQIQTTEAISSMYTFPYPQAYLEIATGYITEIDRESSTITLSQAVPDSILIGDIIEVRNTQVEVNGTTVSCNGNYTVSNVHNKTITVQEVIPTNYTYDNQSVQGEISKNMFIGDVKKVSTASSYTTIYLTNNSPATLEQLQHVFINTNNTRTYYTISSITNQSTFTCTTTSYTGSEPLHTYTPVYPKLQIKEADTSILIEVTSTQDENKFPTGEFIVDNFEQCRAYINTYTGLSVPSYTVYSNIGKTVGGTITVSGLPDIQYAGIFSQKYTPSNTV